MKRRYSSKQNFTSEQEDEIEKLVRFFRRINFTNSSQISNYIVKHNLGNEYPHIAGHLGLKNGDSEWTFEGGIAPKYYREICERLDLGNNGSKAEVIDFTSYAVSPQKRRININPSNDDGAICADDLPF